MTNCSSIRELTDKDLQWCRDLYETDFRFRTMSCELKEGHSGQHLHRVICQYIGDLEITWWASWEEKTGETYAIFQAPECDYYDDKDDGIGYCLRMIHHEGGHR